MQKKKKKTERDRERSDEKIICWYFVFNKKLDKLMGQNTSMCPAYSEPFFCLPHAQ